MGTTKTSALISTLTLACIFIFAAICRAETPAVGEGNFDDGWKLWLDKQAAWQDDALYLPDQVDLSKLPVNAPTGGWDALTSAPATDVTLPATVEEYFWGKNGLRPYNGEYTQEKNDTSVQNGNYLGVSWWYKKFQSPTLAANQRLVLNFRGARLRAEVYCNDVLCAYNIITELPISADLTKAIKPGQDNLIAVRITNPGGRLDFVNSGTFKWGNYVLPFSHGFGGLDGGINLVVRDNVEVSDLAILNLPDPHSVRAIVEVSSAGGPYTGPVNLVLDKSGQAVWNGTLAVNVPAGRTVTVSKDITVSDAELWDMDHPVLYHAVAAIPGLSSSDQSRDFGFRTFTATGIGSDAKLTLNGKRIVVRSAISWGFWGVTGLWPNETMAEKEVTDAKALGLNCLQFHRNLSKPIVLDAQDRMGLLRYEEPGSGVNAWRNFPKEKFMSSSIPLSKLDTSGTGGASDDFTDRYEEAKILGMVKRDRSHPSLVMYCMQNELKAADEFNALANPRIYYLFHKMQEIDPSRIILRTSGLGAKDMAVEALALPWQSEIHHYQQNGYVGWKDIHTVGGPGIYQDSLYTDPTHFSHYSDNHKEIIMWGEMLGSGTPNDYGAIADEYQKSGEPGFDRDDCENVNQAYTKFLDQFGFRADYPTNSALFQSIGAKSYVLWREMIENARISNRVDYAVISGWESTVIENHSGIVDLHRNFKADPAILAAANLPELLVIKSPHLVVRGREEVQFDVFLINETNRHGLHALSLVAKSADGQTLFTATDQVNPAGGDVYGELLRGGYHFSAPKNGGTIDIQATLTPADAGGTLLVQHRSILSVQVAGLPSGNSVAVVDKADGPLWKALTDALKIPATPWSPSASAQVILAQAPPQPEPVDATNKHPKRTKPAPKLDWDGLLAGVKNGSRLVIISDAGPDIREVAKELADRGVLKFNGMVGPSIRSWMGSWYFTKHHWLFDGLPSGTAMNWEYQVAANSKGSANDDGLLIDAPGMDVAAGYSRDHQPTIGIAACVIPVGKGQIVLFTLPGMAKAMEGDGASMDPVAAQRIIANALAHPIN